MKAAQEMQHGMSEAAEGLGNRAGAGVQRLFQMLGTSA